MLKNEIERRKGELELFDPELRKAGRPRRDSGGSTAAKLEGRDSGKKKKRTSHQWDNYPSHFLSEVQDDPVFLRGGPLAR